MILAITGVTGNMGKAVLSALERLDCISELRLLVRNKKRVLKELKHSSLRDKCQIVFGGMTDRSALKSLVEGSDIVINFAAVIPPKSDSNPKAAIDANDTGVQILVSEIEKLNPQPILVHISSVAIYGNRSGDHKFIRVGDPVVPAVYDPYSVTKMRSEWTVLESNIERWIILRQSAMLHPNLFADNIHGGLLFHTVLNCPIEWVTAFDSGVLLANIVEAYNKQEIEPEFWRHCYNIAGGKINRNYGMQSFDNGFSVLGGTTKDFFVPSDIITRNFHCGWFADGDVLEDKFHYQSQSVGEFWTEIFNAHPIFKLGRFVPKCLIRTFLFNHLKRDSLAPKYWARHGDIARLTAYFGSEKEYNDLVKTSWNEFEIPDINEIPSLTDNTVPIHYGYDISKADSELTQADLESVAAAHGGKLLGKFTGDIYEKLEWKTQDDESFFANAYTVLRAGHWYTPLYNSFVWDFDRLAKKDKVLASVWYDSHRKDEDLMYFFDSDYVAKFTECKHS